MKNRTNKIRFIPVDAIEQNYPEAKLVAYLYDAARGPAAVVYKGRGVKPRAHFSFQNKEARENWLTNIVKEETQAEQYVEARRKTAHGLSVGDILVETWGYEQTNVNFFEVLRVPSEITATVQEIKSEEMEHSGTSMTGLATPLPGVFAHGSAPFNRRAWGDGELRPSGSGRGTLRRWDGRPVAYTSYA